MEIIKRLLADEEGQGLVEYGIIVALIAVVCIGAVTTLGRTLKDETYIPISQELGVINKK